MAGDDQQKISGRGSELVLTTARDTRSVRAGRNELGALVVHVPPIDPSATYPLLGVESGGASYGERRPAGSRPGQG